MASAEVSSSGRLLSPATSERLLWVAAAAAAIPLIGAVWWLCETGLNRLAPPQVRCRPYADRSLAAARQRPDVAASFCRPAQH